MQNFFCDLNVLNNHEEKNDDEEYPGAEYHFNGWFTLLRHKHCRYGRFTISVDIHSNRCGRIINISSIIATTGFNGLSVYGATKAALAGFTRSLAREVGKANITVNTLAPGYMETDMTTALQGEKLESIRRRSPLGHLAKVEDAAYAVSYLLSEKAASITGTTITVDAGSTA